MTRTVRIGNHEYVISLTEEHQLQLFLKIPYEKTYKVEPLWQSWDDDDILTVNDDMSLYNSDSAKAMSSTNPWQFSRELKKHILNFIKEHRLTFFYFIPNHYKKGMLYMRMYNQLRESLVDWEAQIYSNKYFYFTKKSYNTNHVLRA